MVAARLGKRFPSVLSMLERAELHLSGIVLLAPYLNSDNHRKLLRQAKGKSQEEIAKIIAAIAPGRAQKDSIRIVAVKAAKTIDKPTQSLPDLFATAILGGSAEDKGSIGASSQSLFALAPKSVPGDGSKPGSLPEHLDLTDLYRISFTATQETTALLRRAQELLRHQFPKGELDGIIQLALKILVDKIDRDRKLQVKTGKKRIRRGWGMEWEKQRQGKSTRYIPEQVRQEAWERDGGRCVYIGEDGVRCGARAWLEFDHKEPWALGGSSDKAENIQILCRAHNLLRGRMMFEGPSPPRAS
jgi:hypothetical protein